MVLFGFLQGDSLLTSLNHSSLWIAIQGPAP